MNRDRIVRAALYGSAIYNASASYVLGFPESPAGRLAQMPAPVPVPYRVLLVTFVLLFAGAYAWLARQPQIDRPLLAFAAIGKSIAFTSVVAMWLCGAVPAIGVATGSGDLLFAVIFGWWLWGR